MRPHVIMNKHTWLTSHHHSYDIWSDMVFEHGMRFEVNKWQTNLLTQDYYRF